MTVPPLKVVTPSSLLYIPMVPFSTVTSLTSAAALFSAAFCVTFALALPPPTILKVLFAVVVPFA